MFLVDNLEHLDKHKITQRINLCFLAPVNWMARSNLERRFDWFLMGVDSCYFVVTKRLTWRTSSRPREDTSLHHLHLFFFPIDRIFLVRSVLAFSSFFFCFLPFGFTTIKDPFHGLWTILPFEWKVICNHRHPPPYQRSIRRP